MNLKSLILICFQILLTESDPVFVGNFTNFHHNIQGSVFTDGDSSLVIKNFYYDGEGPDGDNNVFFYIVNSSYPYSPKDAERGYKNSQGFKRILPFPFTGIFPEYEEENVKDLRIFFRSLKEKQGVASKKGLTRYLILSNFKNQ